MAGGARLYTASSLDDAATIPQITPTTRRPDSRLMLFTWHAASP